MCRWATASVHSESICSDKLSLLCCSSSRCTRAISNEHKNLTAFLRSIVYLLLHYEDNSLSPREMFANENEDAIRQKMNDLGLQVGKSDSGLNEGGLRNKAFDELWEKADKNLWQSKIDNLAKDVDA